jgi:hypothetical protein
MLNDLFFMCFTVLYKHSILLTKCTTLFEEVVYDYFVGFGGEITTHQIHYPTQPMSFYI